MSTQNVLHDSENECQSRKEVSNIAMTAETLLQQLDDELQDAKDTNFQPEKEVSTWQTWKSGLTSLFIKKISPLGASPFLAQMNELLGIK